MNTDEINTALMLSIKSWVKFHKTPPTDLLVRCCRESLPGVGIYLPVGWRPEMRVRRSEKLCTVIAPEDGYQFYLWFGNRRSDPIPLTISDELFSEIVRRYDSSASVRRTSGREWVIQSDHASRFDVGELIYIVRGQWRKNELHFRVVPGDEMRVGEFYVEAPEPTFSGEIWFDGGASAILEGQRLRHVPHWLPRIGIAGASFGFRVPLSIHWFRLHLSGSSDKVLWFQYVYQGREPNKEGRGYHDNELLQVNRKPYRHYGGSRHDRP